MKSPVHNGGFTLLEAIVALTILSVSLISIFTWINTSLNSLQRVNSHTEIELAARNFLEFIRVQDFDMANAGDYREGEVELRWVATPVEPAKPVVTAAGYPGLYDATLYRVHVEAFTSGRFQREFTLRELRYKQVRQPQSDA